MSQVNITNDIPTEGKNLLVVANVAGTLHFRIFDDNGKLVVDKNEQTLKEKVSAIEDLRTKLVKLWPPHEIDRGDEWEVITAVKSIVGLSRSVTDGGSSMAATRKRPRSFSVSTPPTGTCYARNSGVVGLGRRWFVVNCRD